MRKSILYCIVMMTILLMSCGNATVQTIVDAYKDATNQMDEASNDDECVKIHKALLDNLCDIVKADPDFIEKAENGDLSKSDIKQMETAYNEYRNKLQEKSDHWAFMAVPSLKTVKEILNEGNQNNSD